MASILIIEDNPMSMEMATELLSSAGHSVIRAENGTAGVTYAQDLLPDLILVDISLPDVNGLDVVKLLKNEADTLNIPIVAFTAMAMQSDRDKAFCAGCCGFISKPIDVLRFVALVESFLHYKCDAKLNMGCGFSTNENQSLLLKTIPTEAHELLDIEEKNNYDTKSMYSGVSRPAIRHLNKTPQINAHKQDINFKRHKILIVDDNPMNVEIVRETIEQMRQDSVAAYNGRRALELVESEKFDLILLDIMMPEISGFDVIKKLKSKPSTMHIPVIFISALDDTADVVKGFDLGSYEYITKPFKMAELKARIMSVLKIKDLQDQQETFMATLTHDMKTPVLAQMRALEMLLDEKFGKINDTQKNIIQETLNSNKYMFAMVNNLLATHKYENKSVNIVKNLFNINDLIIDCSNQLKYLADDRKQVIKLSFDANVLEINADNLEIKRVVLNIISNAINYSEEGGDIIVSSEEKDGFAIITFIDKGKGISRDDLPNLFSKYKSFAKKFKQIGTGLGLYLSRFIVESHGGTITAESEEGKGSVFTVRLPKSFTE